MDSSTQAFRRPSLVSSAPRIARSPAICGARWLCGCLGLSTPLERLALDDGVIIQAGGGQSFVPGIESPAGGRDQSNVQFLHALCVQLLPLRVKLLQAVDNCLLIPLAVP